MSNTQHPAREALAQLAHDAWSGWINYMFDKGGFASFDVDGTLQTVYVMPPWAVARWSRQAQTPYADLSEEEKESDRREADRMLEIIEAYSPKREVPGSHPFTQELG